MTKKFPFSKQLDSMGCGSACIKMLCDYYGHRARYRSINSHFKLSAEGVSILSIEKVLVDFGFETESYLVSAYALADINLPVILHWSQNHFVILYRISKDGKVFSVADPGKGRLRYSRDEFLARWASTNIDGVPAGVVITATPMPDFAQNHYATDDDSSDWRYILKQIKPYHKHFAQIGLGLLIGCVLQLAMPFLTQAVVDVGINQRDIGFIWLVLLGELMIVTGRTATDFVRRWLLLHISMRVNISLVSDFFIKLLKLPMSFFDTKLMGDLLQRIGDHSRVQGFLTGQVLNILFTALSLIIFGSVLLFYNTAIFGIFIAGSIVYGFWIASFLNRRKVLDYELFELQSINQNRTYQFITSMQEIKLQGCERRRRWEWEDTQADLFSLQMKSMRLQQTQEAGSIFINEVKNIVITVITATAVINGQLTLGAMLAVQYIIGQLNSPVSQLMSFIYSVQDVKISLERINEIHEAQDEEAATDHKKTFGPDKSIIFRHVDFSYDPNGINKTIDDISIVIPENKVTAIVGASGSGKTTLIKLMLGYYPHSAGQITISGQNITDYSPGWWRSRCGVVMQDGVIFSESIARNIAVDDGDIDTGCMEEAANIANIHDFVMGLPLKYDTRIGREGMGLSQGQRQRILIARAVYRNPDFIFLDEATNSLDAKNEKAIVENLESFYRGRTVVIVAHRLSTVRNADQIIVLDGGKVAETGTHDSLIQKKGTYYNLVKNQLELGT